MREIEPVLLARLTVKRKVASLCRMMSTQATSPCASPLQVCSQRHQHQSRSNSLFWCCFLPSMETTYSHG